MGQVSVIIDSEGATIPSAKNSSSAKIVATK